MSAVRAASSSGVLAILRCVERCCPSATGEAFGHVELACMRSMQARRRAGLRSFPTQPLPGSACQGVRSDTALREPGVLRLQLLQSLDLIALQPAVFLAPANGMDGSPFRPQAESLQLEGELQ